MGGGGRRVDATDVPPNVLSLRSETGLGLIEVLAASLIVIVGVLGALLALDAASRDAFAVQRSEQALAVAQREIEQIKALDYQQIGLSSLPVHETGGPENPRSWIAGAKLRLPVSYRDASSADTPGTPAGGEELVSGGAVSPGPTPFAAGTTRGRVYRFVSWRPEDCIVGTVDRCPGTHDTKRVTVAVVLDAVGGRAAAPIWVSTVIADPNAAPLGVTAVPPEASPGSGPAVSAQPFFLYDTPCSASSRQAITGDHSSHDTGRTGATCGGTTPPDLMGPDSPPAAADGSAVPRHDFSTEVVRTGAAGLALRRGASGCPTSYASASERATVHRWATAPFASEFATPSSGARTAVRLWTRTVDGAPASAMVCARLHTQSLPLVTLASTTYTLASWPTEPTAVAFTIDHSPFTVNVGDRLVFTLSVHSTSASDIEVRYDHPEDRTFLSVATITPLS